MKIGYARVSTVDQCIDMQIDALKNANCEEVYQDKSSGRDFDRKELTACLKALRSGDTLVVWKLDRIGRSTKNLIQTVENLKERNIGFASLTEQLDTTTSGGKLIFSVFASIAEFERNLISERTKEGLAAARRRGRNGGRPQKMSKKDVRLARTMLKDEETTVKEVAAHFNIGRNTLYRYLNEDHKGNLQ